MDISDTDPDGDIPNEGESDAVGVGGEKRSRSEVSRLRELADPEYRRRMIRAREELAKEHADLDRLNAARYNMLRFAIGPYGGSLRSTIGKWLIERTQDELGNSVTLPSDLDVLLDECIEAAAEQEAALRVSRAKR